MDKFENSGGKGAYWIHLLCHIVTAFSIDDWLTSLINTELTNADLCERNN